MFHLNVSAYSKHMLHTSFAYYTHTHPRLVWEFSAEVGRSEFIAFLDSQILSGTYFFLITGM